MVVNWNYWLAFEKLKAWQACMLSMNMDPRDVRTTTTGAPIFEPASFTSLSKQATFIERLQILLSNLSRFQQPFPSARPPDKNRQIFLQEFADWAVVRWKPLPAQLVRIAQATAPSGTKPNAPPVVAWHVCAREIGERIHKNNPRLNVEQIAAKVRSEMQERLNAGKSGMTGRGNRIPTAATIKRHALRYLKH